jgi:flagellar hook assembly protein FlgD
VTGVGDAPRAAAGISSLPNPFRSGTQVRFALAAAGPARVEVRDLAGRAVRTLHDGPLPAGPQAFAWDGADAAGRSLPGGIYFIHVRAGGTQLGHKVVLGR